MNSNKHPLNKWNIIQQNLTYRHVNEFIKKIKTKIERNIIMNYFLNTKLIY